MKFHKQLLVDPKKGDCFRTCIACILDRDPESVPNFLEQSDGGEYWRLLSEWLHGEGLGLLRLYPDRPEWFGQAQAADGALCIASIPSLRFKGLTHAVVAQVQVSRDEHGHYITPSLVLVHDPSPLNPPYPWFTKSESVHFLVPRIGDRLPTFTRTSADGA